MSIQKDCEGLINEAMDAMETVREKLQEINELVPDIDVMQHSSKLVVANEALNDILADIESLDA